MCLLYRLDYNHLISNKHVWNNCFNKNASHNIENQLKIKYKYKHPPKLMLVVTVFLEDGLIDHAIVLLDG